MNLIKALLITVVICTLGYFICRDSVESAAHPVYSPDGTCIVNCQ